MADLAAETVAYQQTLEAVRRECEERSLSFEEYELLLQDATKARMAVLTAWLEHA